MLDIARAIIEVGGQTVAIIIVCAAIWGVTRGAERRS